jgi:AraC family transcriptional regulator, regulatory protein of adaptative response / methylated-DNA-[protein]-cysteine methyltransferase
MDAITQSTAVAEVFHVGYGETKQGIALIALSNRGVVAILLGEDRLKLRRELGDAFPGIHLIESGADFAGKIAKVITFIDSPEITLDLPLDLRGSRLELAVWRALRAIPSGETRTYGAIAKELPMPATAQEVGAACAANVLAVAVPCHRVVKADGSISGYRWGVQRKRRLISAERLA